MLRAIFEPSAGGNFVAVVRFRGDPFLELASGGASRVLTGLESLLRLGATFVHGALGSF